MKATAYKIVGAFVAALVTLSTIMTSSAAADDLPGVSAVSDSFAMNGKSPWDQNIWQVMSNDEYVDGVIVCNVVGPDPSTGVFLHKGMDPTTVEAATESYAQSGTYYGSYQLCQDGYTDDSVATLTITVTAAPPEPTEPPSTTPTANPDDFRSVRMNPGYSYRFNLVANDTDPNGKPLRLNWCGQLSRQHGFISGKASINPDGKSITFTPARVGIVGVVVLKCTVSNGTDTSNQASVKLRVARQSRVLLYKGGYNRFRARNPNPVPVVACVGYRLPRSKNYSQGCRRIMPHRSRFINTRVSFNVVNTFYGKNHTQLAENTIEVKIRR